MNKEWIETEKKRLTAEYQVGREKFLRQIEESAYFFRGAQASL